MWEFKPFQNWNENCLAEFTWLLCKQKVSLVSRLLLNLCKNVRGIFVEHWTSCSAPIVRDHFRRELFAQKKLVFFLRCLIQAIVKFDQDLCARCATALRHEEATSYWDFRLHSTKVIGNRVHSHHDLKYLIQNRRKFTIAFRCGKNLMTQHESRVNGETENREYGETSQDSFYSLEASVSLLEIPQRLFVFNHHQDR